MGWWGTIPHVWFYNLILHKGIQMQKQEKAKTAYFCIPTLEY